MSGIRSRLPLAWKAGEITKLVWRVKLVAELGSDLVSEVEVGRIERDDRVTSETLGLTLDESKRLIAAAQVDIFRAQVAVMGERFRCCEHCGLATLHCRTDAERIRDFKGVAALRQHVRDLIAYLEANRSGLVNYGARRRRGEPISTGFVESAINEIISRRMIKRQQMRWNRWTVQCVFR